VQQHTLAERPELAREDEAARPQATAGLPPAPPAAIHAVIEHDEVESEAHKPVRRRRQKHEEAASNVAAALQLVETQAGVPAAATEDDLPHRTKPRRRRSGQSASEPLQMVETQPGTNPPQTP
jgi:hypothetical protein